MFDALAGLPPASGYPQIDLRNGVAVLDFDDSADEYVDFLGVLPRGYAGSDLAIVITWAATAATSGDVVWQVALERQAIADPTYGTHDLDADDFGPASSSTAPAPVNAGELVRSIIAVAAGDAHTPVAGDTYRLRVTRHASVGSDTLAGDAELVAVEIREA